MGMSLPKLSQKTYTETLPISKLDIVYTPYTVAQEKALIQTIEQEGKDDKLKMLNAFFNMLNETVKEPENIDLKSLSMVDFMYILLLTRAVSKGEKADFNMECKSCGKKYESSQDLIKSCAIENENSDSFFHKIDDSVTLEIAPPKVSMLFDSAKKKSISDEDVLAYSISSVNYEGEVYTDFTTDDVYESIISRLTKKQVDSALSNLDNLPYLVLRFESTCAHCNANNLLEVSDPSDFLLPHSTTSPLE